MPQTVLYGGHAPTALAVGDFNGDGKIDLAVADEDDQLVTRAPERGRTAPSPLPCTFNVGADTDFLHAAPLYPPRTGDALGAAGETPAEFVVLYIRCRRLARQSRLGRRWRTSPTACR